MSALKYWVWLSELRGLNNQTRLALLHHFGTPEEVFYADTGELLLTEGITKAQADAVQSKKDLTRTDRILADCQRLGIRILTIGDGAYPGRLENIYDPPCLLYVLGHLPDLDEEAAVSVVGTRSCTPYGETCAEKLGYGMAAGGAVVASGLAKGIDAAAIRGALRAGGSTIGVLGNGVDVRYPWESRFLYEDVAATGALISEYPPGTSPDAPHFPVRNRILAGISVATLVVEAPLRSGALITAHMALEQGRDVYAVPGPIDAPSSAGCNRLIRDGAGLVAEPEDLLLSYLPQFPGKLHLKQARQPKEVLGYQARQVEPAKPELPTLSAAESGLTEEQLLLLRTLTEEPIQVDDLIEAVGLPTRQVLAALTVLEIEDLVTQHSGKYYTRNVTVQE